MTKKYVIEEAWLLDDNDKEILKLTPLDIDTIPQSIKVEDIRGGYGNIKDN